MVYRVLFIAFFGLLTYAAFNGDSAEALVLRHSLDQAINNLFDF